MRQKQFLEARRLADSTRDAKEYHAHSICKKIIYKALWKIIKNVKLLVSQQQFTEAELLANSASNVTGYHARTFSLEMIVKGLIQIGNLRDSHRLLMEQGYILLANEFSVTVGTSLDAPLPTLHFSFT